jgi:hypothetical protein
MTKQSNPNVAAISGVFLCLWAAVVSATESVVVDTGQSGCYDNAGYQIECPAAGEAYFGQDAQLSGVQPTYRDNGDGTVTDLNTGLMWVQTPDLIDKSSWDQAMSGAADCRVGGHSDWRLPTIKELYSLINFDGWTGLSAGSSRPYIDTAFFAFEYGQTSHGERFIDAQYCSSTEYVATTMNGDHTVFGVNFADGRIKGYPTSLPNGSVKNFYVRYVRGNPGYGTNDFVDNGDGTVTDRSTGLMWSQDDSGTPMIWEDALAWVEQKNNEVHLGHSDWRLPNAKELQSIVDYSRSPDTTSSAAIDPLFETTPIVNEGGRSDYPFFWSGTTHLEGTTSRKGDHAAYVAFGRALGWMESPPHSGSYQLLDVHGAGSQRSDPKIGDPDDYPYGHGPQGDVIRIYNFVRLVRDAGCQAVIIDSRFEALGRDPAGPETVCIDAVLPPVVRLPSERRGAPAKDGAAGR